MAPARGTKAKRPRGRPKTLPDSTPFVLRLPTDLHRELRRYAHETGTSMNSAVVEALRAW